MTPHYPKVWLDSHGLVNLEFATHAHITLDMIQQAQHKCAQLNTPHKRLLVHAEQINEYDYEAMRYLWEQSSECTVEACAVVLKSYLSLHLGKRLMFYHRPPFQTKLFEDENEAAEWLLSLPIDNEAEKK